MQHLLHLLATEVKERRRRAAHAALMIDESRLEPAMAVEVARVAGRHGDRLDIRIALGARHVVVDPGRIEELHERPVEGIDPDHWLSAVIAVVVPSPVRGEDKVAAIGSAALALDNGVAALVGENGAARIR